MASNVRVNGIHSRKHPTVVDGCWTCKAATVQVGDLQGINRRDREFAADQEAYKRLRKDGLQPDSPVGAAALESNVRDQLEIDYKIPIAEKDLPRVKEIQAEVAMAQFAGGVR